MKCNFLYLKLKMSLLNLEEVTSLHSILDQHVWNAEDINTFLGRKPSTVNEVDPYHETPLFRVLESDNCTIDLVRLLLDYGADLNGINYSGESPLTAALYNNRDGAIIKDLLEKGADVKVRHRTSGASVLCYALRLGASKDVVKLLLEAGCHPNACKQHVSALDCASDLPKDALGEGVLELLIEAGANLLRSGLQGQSPLCFALQAGAGTNDIGLLLEQDALLECAKHGSIWVCATEHIHPRYVLLGKTFFSWSPLLRSDVVELLSKKGAGPLFSDRSIGQQSSPLKLALVQCRYETRAIEMLLDLSSGSNAEVRDPDVCNLLHSAVKNPNCEPNVIQLLIERGASVDGVDKGGKTPLRVAVESKSRSDVVQHLLSAGARIGVRNGDFSLLQLALDQYLQKECPFTLESLKLLVKYYFLEDTDFKVERLAGWKTTEILALALKHLADQCAREVEIMKSSNIDDHRTLLDLFRQRPLPHIVIDDMSPELIYNIQCIVFDHCICQFSTDIMAIVR